MKNAKIPKRWSIFAGTVLLCVAVSCLLYFGLKMSFQLLEKNEVTLLVKTSDVDGFSSETEFKCPNTTIENLTFPMCLYEPRVDRYISGSIMRGIYFEKDLVVKTVELLSRHKDVTFVDLGANLGTYSLPVAHSGIHVMAVEANRETVRRLTRSVYLGHIQDTIDIFPYAISSERSNSFLGFDSNNRGDTFMVRNVSCPSCVSVEVITLDTLIPFVKSRKVLIKVDIQEAEIKVFTLKGAGKFFSEIDVLMIQMEWDFYRKRYVEDASRRRKVDRFLKFFYQRGFEVYDPRTESKLGSDWTKWTYDVMFKRNDLPRDKLFQI